MISIDYVVIRAGRREFIIIDKGVGPPSADWRAQAVYVWEWGQTLIID
jgi:hypothetical protein